MLDMKNRNRYMKTSLLSLFSLITSHAEKISQVKEASDEGLNGVASNRLKEPTQMLKHTWALRGVKC